MYTIIFLNYQMNNIFSYNDHCCIQTYITQIQSLILKKTRTFLKDKQNYIGDKKESK